MWKEQNDAMIRAQGVHPPLLQTPSNITSKDVDAISERVFKLRYLEQKRLKAEIVQNELPLRVRNYVYMFLKQSRTFVQLFVSELCPSNWHHLIQLSHGVLVRGNAKVRQYATGVGAAF